MAARETRTLTHLGETWLSLGSYEDVLNSDFNYWEVKKQLKEAGMEMVKILRIHNSHLKERFECEKEHFMKNRPAGFDLNIQDLYHATRVPLDKICEEGLDERESPAGHFGRGIYFSDSPEMCRVYCEDKSASSSSAAAAAAAQGTGAEPRQYFMMRCNVILGHPKVYFGSEYDVSLTREPVKCSTGGKTVYFDSVQGQVGSYTQYVVYEKRRVNIEYVVYYTTSRPLPVLPDVPVHTNKSRRTPGRGAAAATAGATGRLPSEERAPSDDETRPTSDDDGDTGDRRVGRRRRSSGDSVDSVDSAGQLAAAAAAAAASEPATSGGGAQKDIKKVTVTRQRTHRLMNATTTAAAAVTATGAMSSTASATAAPQSTANAAFASRGGGDTVFQPSVDTSPSTAMHRQSIQEAAIRELLDLKGKVPESKLNELLTSYTLTYGQLPSTAFQPPASSPSTSASATATARGSRSDDDDDDNLQASSSLEAGDIESSAVGGGDHGDGGCDDDNADNVEQVMSNLVAQFSELVPGVDVRIARQYIEQYNMDPQAAFDAYFDDNPG